MILSPVGGIEVVISTSVKTETNAYRLNILDNYTRH